VTLVILITVFILLIQAVAICNIISLDE